MTWSAGVLGLAIVAIVALGVWFVRRCADQYDRMKDQRDSVDAGDER